ncbi:choice-of-anchor J domain-containing protein [Flavobacterium sp. RHBU_3]|uniref:Ig-like domain-containing protein n=1 Tax=Flavobacterium sp. RHBU_3 TaxID=3391184 RepID=UPI00398556BC
MLLLSASGFAQLALEDFEGTWTPLSGTEGSAGPTGWYIKNVSGPVQYWIQGNGSTAQPAYSGTHAAYLNKENVASGTQSEDWLVTPLFTVPANAQLKFWSRLTVNGDQGTSYKVMIGTDITQPFTDLQTWTELTLNTVQQEYEQKVVDIPAAYNGQQVYVAFVMMGDDGDRWLVDDVQVVEQCIIPTALGANPSGTYATLNWTSTSTNFEVEVVTNGTSPTGVGVSATGTSYTTPATLTPQTTYQYYVRAVCGDGNNSEWAGPYTFTTSQIPGTLNFTDGFESTQDWAIVNGTQTNKWYYGTATSNGGTNSIYVSNDNGANNAYTLNTLSTVMAYRDIQMPAAVDQLTLSFDWKNQGESGWDYLRVWLVPATYTPVAGTQTTAANSGGIQIGGNFGLNSSWSTYTTTINAAAYAGTVRRLIFEWRNDTSLGTQPPAAVDNINLSIITCPAPTNFTLGTVTESTANFTWTGPSSVTPTYDIYFSTNNTAPVAATSPTTNVTPASFSLSSLTPNTTYYIWVRSNCGSGDYSTWVGPISFTTTQIPAILNYTQDFEGTHGFGFDNGTQPNKWIVGSATSNGGTKSLYITNDNGTSNAFSITTQSTVHAYRDILIPAGTSEINLSFDWKAYGESCCDYLRVWMVPVTYTPVAGTLMTAANSGGIQVGGNFNVNGSWTNYLNTINVSAYAGQVRRLVFEWRNDGSIGTQPPAAVDNINITIVTCPKPINLAAVQTSTSATLSWTPQGTETSWEVYVVPTGTAAPTATTTGTTVTTSTGYTYSPLNPATTYQYYVRAICSDSDKSIWSGPFSFTTAIINDNYDGAVDLTVNSGTDCTVTTAAAFTGATSSTLSLPTCSPYTTNGPDIWYQFTATSSLQTLSLSGFAGTAQQVVISIYEGTPADGGELFCSANNAVNMVGLTPGTTYYVRLTLNPTTTTISLTTTFNICITTPSSATNSDCEITTINPSFELPDMAHTNSGQGPTFFLDYVVPGWKTGATDHAMEYWIEPNYEHQPAYHTNTGTDLFVTWPAAAPANSDQFIELNANANQGTTMGVYQDYTAAPGTVFVVKFAHRARNTNYASASYAASGNVIDVMRLMAGPVPAAGQTLADVIDTYTQVGTNFSTSANGVPSGYPGVSGASVANGGNGTAWAYYGADGTLTYTVPAGQTTTRFFFQAVSTSTGNTSVGNFLDAITFTANNAITSTNPAVADCDPTTTDIFNYVNVEATGGGTWIAHADNPSATIIADPTANSTTISGFTVPGTYQYDWTTAYCTNLLTVTYTAPDIAAPTGQDTYTYCQGNTATTLTATALDGYVLNWYDVETGGTASATAPTPDTSVVGTTTYYVSQSSTAGACESPRLPITVTVNETPVAPTTEDVTYCQTATAAELTATAADGNTLNWYTDPTGGTATTTAPTPDTSVAGTTTYYVSQVTPAGCEGPRAPLNVIVSAPTAQVTTFTLPASVCIAGTNPVATLDATAVTTGTFTTSDPTNLVIDATTGEIDLTLSTAGTYDVTYSIAGDVTTCVAPSATTVSITITPLATPVTTFTYTNVCESAANQLPVLDAGFAANGTFTSSDPANLVVDATTGEIDMALSNPGTYTVTYSVAEDATSCMAAATSDAVTITITPLVAPSINISYPTVCGLEATVAPSADPALTGATYADANSTGTLSIDATTGVIDLANSTPGMYTISYTYLQDDTTCSAAGVYTTTVEITAPSTPVTGFQYTNVCSTAANQLPALFSGFTTGGTFTADAGLTVDAITGEIDMANSTAGTYTVTYTLAANVTGCVASGSNTAQVTITPAFTPEVGFTYDEQYCFGTGTILPELASGFAAGGTFTVSGGLTINSSTGEISLAGVAAGTYSVTYTVGADASTCNLGNSHTENFNLNGEIAFTLDGVCNGPSFIITATPTDESFDTSLVTYQWTTASGTPIGSDSEELNVSAYVASLSTYPSFPMDITLTVTNNGCSVPVTYTVDGITCEIQRGISPGGTDDLNDFFDLTGFGAKKLTIFNRYGKEVYAKTNYTNEWHGQTNNGEELPTGTYFYAIDRTEGASKTGWIYINRQN